MTPDRGGVLYRAICEERVYECILRQKLFDKSPAHRSHSAICCQLLYPSTKRVNLAAVLLSFTDTDLHDKRKFCTHLAEGL